MRIVCASCATTGEGNAHAGACPRRACALHACAQGIGHERPHRGCPMTLDDLFNQSEDEPLPGGCERCNAFHTFESVAPGVVVLNVHHDDWCPELRAQSARSN